MARTGQYTAETFVAENDLSSALYKFVELNASADNQVDVPDAIGDITVGVLLNQPTAGKAASVATSGLVKVLAGATITTGDKICTSATGTGIVANSGSVWVAGIAVSDAAATGYFTMKIEGFHRVV